MARKAIDKDVLRELYMRSGNICAFPECNHPIMNSDGVYVAQMCHIEAASPKGQRYNKNQTDDERAGYDNLLLMCYRHHKETDDVQAFPVSKLKQIKKDHEAKFSSVLDALANDVHDLAYSATIQIPTSLSKFVVLGDITSAEEADYLDELQELSQQLLPLSPVTRKILMLALRRVDNEQVNFFDFIQSVSMPERDVFNHLRSLESAGLISDNEDSDLSERKLTIKASNKSSPFPISILISDYCSANNSDAHKMIVNLDFSELA
ncbi:hypothetical protein AB6C74_18245 [Vibrio splendidus]